VPLEHLTFEHLLERDRAGQTDGGAGGQLCERTREDAGQDAGGIGPERRPDPDLFRRRATVNDISA
jgi:hypothetical protein